METPTILVCDDEADIVSALRIYLEAEGYRVLTAANGKEAVAIVSRESVQLVVMDIMMPVMDGITAMTRIREHCNLPVILLTAKGEDNDKVLGLTVGADDYVTKPFNPLELMARIRSQLRRYTQLGSVTGQPVGTVGQLTVGAFSVDERTRTVSLYGEALSLTPTEYEILRLFLRRPGEVISPKEIYRRVWQDEPFGADSTVNVAVCLAGLAASICLLVFLLSAAGRHPGEDGVREGAIDRVPFDLFTFFVGLLEAVMLLLLLTALPTVGGSMFSASAVLIIAVYIPAMLLLIGYAMSLAVRIKAGTVFRHTLVWICLRAVGQSLRWLFRRTRAALQAIPPVRRAFVLLLVLLALNLSVGYALMVGGYAGIFLLLVLLELMVLGACALRYALGLRRLQDGAAHLAKGEFEYRVSTAGLPDDCRVSAENLNRIGQGLADAVEQRMKSEHFRTELITNVSHDIKTPLTSIVNYVELIRQLSPTDETLCTYIDVLDRQSTRLKKLIDDLLEASKASSGVLNVIPAPCEVGVLLEQVQGEYAERLHAHDLNLIVQTPDKTLTVLADGRHLGRIFDNLMNNIIKYAQPGTRVYLDARAGLDPAAPGGSRPVAVITFRNVSAEPLNIPAEELLERFVRGDASRHTEGSGLGLAIVQSLTELQGGSLQLAIDGDLFKVRLTFPLYTPADAAQAASSGKETP